MAWVALAAAVIGAAATYSNNRSVAKKQDRANAMGMLQNAEVQRKANARVNSTVQQIAKSDGEGVRNSARKSYLDQVARKMSQANAGLATRGISAQFDQMAGGAANDANAYAGQVAELMSRIDAGGLQRQAEANVMGDMGMDLDVLSGDVAGNNHLTDMRIRGVRRNPWLDAVAGAANAYASSGGGGGRPQNGSGGAPGGYNGAGVTTINRGGNYGGYT